MKKLKYLISILMLLSIGIYVFPFIETNGTVYSIVQIIKRNKAEQMGFGWDWLQERTYVQWILLVIAVLLLGCALTLLLPGKASYYTAIVLAVLNNIGLIFTMIFLKNLLSNGQRISILSGKVPLLVWGAFYAGIVLISVIVIVLPGKKEDHRIILDDIPKNIMVQDEISHYDENRSTEIQRPYYGAVLGCAGEYIGKVYPMREMRQVFFKRLEGNIIVSDNSSGEYLAAVYYVKDYQEYCMTVNERLCVYLRSGQPLGKGREYYLPRGTYFYVADSSQQFILA